jgi:myo-inositol-hexaphosphate 3-phosphohydrolase
VPITVGIRGNRNTEIIGDIAKGTTVLSPARRDLADGTRIRIDNSLTKAVEAVAPSEPVADQPVAAPEPAVLAATTTSTPTDPDDAVISAAMTAHVDSVVNDARRNLLNR